MRLFSAAAACCLFAVVLAHGEDRVVSARSDWPQWRGGPHQTGSQGVAGRIRVPRVAASFRLGGFITPYQFLVSDRDTDLVVLAPAGELMAWRRSGQQLWARRFDTNPALVGFFDLDADGRREILATTNDPSGGFLDLFDALTGELLWSSDVEDSATGAVEVGDIDGDGKPDLVWAPAASSEVRAYSFATGIRSPRLLWQRELAHYKSDPYGPSPVAIADLDSDGTNEVVIAGGRAQFTLWILEGSTGEVRQRGDYFNEEGSTRVTEGGGLRQMVEVRDLDHDGRAEIILVSAYGSASSYMFQGAAVIDSGEMSNPIIRDSHPFGTRYVDGSLQDFDGDGADELLVSFFEPSTRQHVIQLLDARTLALKQTTSGLLAAIVRPTTESDPVIIACENVRDEEPTGPQDYTGLKIEEGRFVPMGWHIRSARLITAERPYDMRPEVAHGGPRALSVDADNNGTRDVLFGIGTGSSAQLSAIDISTGSTVKSFAAGPDDQIQTLYGSDADPDLVLLSLASGSVLMLNNALSGTATIPIGGFFRLGAGNGHNNEVAIVADLDGDGVNEIYANTTRSQVLRLDFGGASSSRRVFSSRNTSSDKTPQEPLAVPHPKGSVLVRSCNAAEPRSICLLNAEGAVTWSRSTALIVPAALAPVGLNIGFDAVANRHVLFASGSTIYPMPVYALDASTGDVLWTAPNGPYWDAAFAVVDFNGDGVDDVMLNYNTEKGTILNGRDGSVICKPTITPRYGDLGFVDYNGVPITVDVDADGVNEVLIGEDNAHMTMLRSCVGTGLDQVQVRWTARQSSIDDERLSMPGLALDSRGNVIIGTGTRHGVLVARSAASGETLWKSSLFNGVKREPVGTNALSSVLAVDVDGRNGMDFVVGGADGWLYAVNATSGKLVWSFDLGTAVGDPIAADVDSDGASEIVVTVADGFLYVIDGAPTRRRAVH